MIAAVADKARALAHYGAIAAQAQAIVALTGRPIRCGRCDCGATDCPDCGPAQGYEVVKRWSPRRGWHWVNPDEDEDDENEDEGDDSAQLACTVSYVTADGRRGCLDVLAHSTVDALLTALEAIPGARRISARPA